MTRVIYEHHHFSRGVDSSLTAAQHRIDAFLCANPRPAQECPRDDDGDGDECFIIFSPFLFGYHILFNETD